MCFLTWKMCFLTWKMCFLTWKMCSLTSVDLDMTGFVVALKYLKVIKSIRESNLLTREGGRKNLISKKNIDTTT